MFFLLIWPIYMCYLFIIIFWLKMFVLHFLQIYNYFFQLWFLLFMSYDQINNQLYFLWFHLFVFFLTYKSWSILNLFFFYGKRWFNLIFFFQMVNCLSIYVYLVILSFSTNRYNYWMNKPFFLQRKILLPPTPSSLMQPLRI